MKSNFKSNQCKVPVLFIVFNRPDVTQQVFNKIREASPKELYVSADGPRLGVDSDIEASMKTREIIKQVDWDCEVFTNFRVENVGCKLGVSSAIDWFFENVEEGIILEDDCLPNPSFFPFCQKMLERFRHNDSIKMISGDNFQLGQIRGDGDYYFSRLPGIWGWATWKRAWKLFDLSMSRFPEFKNQNQIKNIFSDKKVQEFWVYKFQQAFDNNSAWAFAWAFTILIENGYCIYPNKNLISNIGFGPGAVHAKNVKDPLSNMQSHFLNNLSHPSFLLPDMEADIFHSLFFAKLQMPRNNMKTKLVNLIRKFIKKIN